MTRSLLAYKEAWNFKLKIYDLQRLNQGVIPISNDWDFILSPSRGGGGGGGWGGVGVAENK